MRKRWLSLALAAALSITALSGCSGEETAAQGSTVQTMQEQTEEVSSAENESVTEGEASDQGLYIPGEYSATVKGFGGDVTVTIVVDENKITECRIEGAEETDGVGSRAVEELPGEILEAQSAEVEAVAGATVTSDAIVQALEEALKEASGETVSDEEVSAGMTPGTYRGSAKGMNGTIVVDVTVSEETIDNIEFVETIPRENDMIDESFWLSNYLIDMLDETPQIMVTVTDRLPERIIESQSLAVDAVAGATVSSNGFINAVKDALEQSGANLAAFDKVPEKSTETEEYEADVIVIGGGTSGATAAAMAAESGANVLLIEKSGRLGGSGSLSSEPMTLGAEIQKEAGFDPDPEEMYEEWMSQTHWAVNGYIVSKFLNNSGQTVDWLIDKGFEFVYNPTDTPLFWIVSYRDHSIGTMTQYNSFNQMCSDVDTILYETTAQSLILDENGAVTGVNAVKYDGTTVVAKAKAVIVATGGYGGSKELMEKYNGAYFKMLGLTQNVGEGLTMMLEAGAKEHHVGGACAHQTEVPVQISGFDVYDTAIPYTITNLPVLMRVDSTGQRFMDENEKASSPTASSSFVASNGGEFYTILTQEQYDILKEQGSAGLGMDKNPDPSFLTWPLGPDDAMTNLDAVMEAAEEIGMAFQADTLEELAALTGMDADVLTETVRVYNESCEAGRDTMFYKDAQYMYPYDLTGPFYAVKGCVMSYNSLGGVQVDEFMRVLNTENQVIPGLYAVGVDSIGTVLDGVAYPDLFGVALGWGFNSGRMAGEYAADYALNN